MAKRGQKGKYNPDNLTLIKKWVRDGATNENIAQKLGISVKTFYEWLKKYSELREAVKRNKEIVDTEVENALLKSALGYEYVETVVKEGTDAKSGLLFRTVETYTKHAAPNLGSCVFWLKNRMKDVWRDKIVSETDNNDGSINALVEALRKSENPIEKDKPEKPDKNC